MVAARAMVIDTKGFTMDAEENGSSSITIGGALWKTGLTGSSLVTLVSILITFLVPHPWKGQHRIVSKHSVSINPSLHSSWPSARAGHDLHLASNDLRSWASDGRAAKRKRAKRVRAKVLQEFMVVIWLE